MDPQIDKDNEIETPDISLQTAQEGDGIGINNNSIPRWWLNIFIVLITLSAAYWLTFRSNAETVPDVAKLEAELDRIEAARLSGVQGLNDKKLLEMSRNSEFLSEGRKVYDKRCATCHGPDLRATGKKYIGVNLRDKEWIHGGKPMEIFNIISKGVPKKSMQPWQATLGTKKTAQATAYILSLQK